MLHTYSARMCHCIMKMQLASHYTNEAHGSRLYNAKYYN